MPNHAPAAERGFGLVEALVALALIALVLALALLVLFRLGRGFAELTARRDAVRATEAVLESVRAGALPLAPGRYELPPEPEAPPVEERRISLEISPAGSPGLYQVAAEGRWRLFGREHLFRLESLAWSGP